MHIELYKTGGTTDKILSPSPGWLDEAALRGYLPGHISAAAAAHEVSTRMEAPILVIDDNDDVRSAVGELLRDEGYGVVEASDGKKALDYLFAATTIPSLILLDLNMPVMSGWEVIGALRSHLRFAKLPIILVTGERRTTDPVNQAIVGRLSKPIFPDDLLALVRRHVAEPSPPSSVSRALPD